MKTYLIVTNDEFEFPVSGEIVGAEEAAKRLGIKKQRFRRCLCDGFPKKSKYKAVIIQERQNEDQEEYRRKYSKSYSMSHDRTEYFRERYRKMHK